jgi:hypothetical protein
MVSTSLRHLASCIGLEGSFSVVRDFFGYAFRGHERASLLTQARLLQGPHLHVNLIRVGIENFDDADEREIDRALERLREIYRQVPLGVGRAERSFIAEIDAMASGVVGSVLVDDGSAKSLMNDWSGPGADALDVFWILHWSADRNGKIGVSPIGGSCDKDGGICDKSTGAMISLQSRDAGKTMAHEMGHYLDLPHIHELEGDDIDIDGDGGFDPDDHGFFPASVLKNLMFPSQFAEGGEELDASQREIMRVHCFVRPGC